MEDISCSAGRIPAEPHFSFDDHPLLCLGGTKTMFMWHNRAKITCLFRCSLIPDQYLPTDSYVFTMMDGKDLRKGIIFL